MCHSAYPAYTDIAPRSLVANYTQRIMRAAGLTLFHQPPALGKLIAQPSQIHLVEITL